MIFSDSEVEDINYTLHNLHVGFDDKFGIMTLSIYGNLFNHFRTWCQWNTADNDDVIKNKDKLIIKYFTKTSCKNYITVLPVHIKNKIIANSL